MKHAEGEWMIHELGPRKKQPAFTYWVYSIRLKSEGANFELNLIFVKVKGLILQKKKLLIGVNSLASRRFAGIGDGRT